jgi:hypothetical protein
LVAAAKNAKSLSLAGDILKQKYVPLNKIRFMIRIKWSIEPFSRKVSVNAKKLNLILKLIETATPSNRDFGRLMVVV